MCLKEYRLIHYYAFICGVGPPEKREFTTYYTSMVNYMYAHHLGEVCEQETLNTNSTSRYFGQLRPVALVSSGQLPRSAQASCLGQLRPVASVGSGQLPWSAQASCLGQLRPVASVGSGQLPWSAQGSCLGRLRAAASVGSGQR